MRVSLTPLAMTMLEERLVQRFYSLRSEVLALRDFDKGLDGFNRSFNALRAELWEMLKEGIDAGGLMSFGEVAAHLSCSRSHVSLLAKRGVLKRSAFVRNRILRDSVLAYALTPRKPGRRPSLEYHPVLF